jgi:cell division protein FtsQ
MSRASGLMRRGLPASTAGVSAPADKRFRRPDARQARRRGLRKALRRAAWWAAGGLVVMVVLGWAVYAAAESSVLRVSHITIIGNAHLSPADVETLLTGLEHENILAVDLDAYRAKVMKSSWVQSVTLRRVLPATIEVRITERAPIAIARIKQQLFLVDGAGVIIDPYGPQYREFDLPIVDGLTGSAADAAAPVDPERVALVQRLLHDLAPRPDLVRRLSQVDVSNPRDAVVLIDDEPARLHLGDEEFLQRLQRYEESAARLHEQFPVIDYIELRFGKNVFVRPRDAPAPVAVRGGTE